MIFLVNAENRGQFAADLRDMREQREPPEIDIYDRDEALYLLAKAEPEGQVLASARLLPTTGPHLMSDRFAAACRDTPPRGPNIWEVSRFSITSDLHGGGMCLGLLWELIGGIMEAALLYGIDQVIFMASRALLPVALNCGCGARALGSALREGGDEMTAVTAAITPAGRGEVRRRHGAAGPITRLLASSAQQAALILLQASIGSRPRRALPGRRDRVPL